MPAYTGFHSYLNVPDEYVLLNDLFGSSFGTDGAPERSCPGLDEVFDLEQYDRE